MPKHPPSFDLFISDFRDGCRFLELDEIGAYLLLLIEQFERGSIPQNAEQLAIICQRCDAAVFKRIWANLQTKFEETETGFANPKMADVREKTFHRWEVNKRNGSKRWQNRPKEPSDMPSHLLQQSDVEGEGESGSDKTTSSPERRRPRLAKAPNTTNSPDSLCVRNHFDSKKEAEPVVRAEREDSDA